ncbi:MAG: 2-oxoglutarate dehydrogenase E1 component, partial [Verrucomicrobia bacterium]
MHPSFATRLNLDLLEQNYERWQKDPDSLDSGWSAFFEGFELGNLDGKNGAAVAVAPPEARRDLRESPLQTRIDALVYAYRILGHTIARVNPLAEKRPENPLLTLREFGFSDKDLDYPVASKFFLDGRQMTLREMIALLDQIYAGSIGAEFQHIQNTRIRDWVRHRLESRIFAPPPSPEIQVALLRSLLEAETFEVFLHTSYVGQKRFSLQGAEGLMAILDTLLHKCASDGIEEICMGMAHRGRLNVLAN